MDGPILTCTSVSGRPCPLTNTHVTSILTSAFAFHKSFLKEAASVPAAKHYCVYYMYYMPPQLAFAVCRGSPGGSVASHQILCSAGLHIQVVYQR